MRRAASTPAEIWIELLRKGQRAITLQPCTGSPDHRGSHWPSLISKPSRGLFSRGPPFSLVPPAAKTDALLGVIREAQHHLDAVILQQEENQPFFFCELRVCENTAHEQSLKSLMLMCVHPSQFPL